MNYQASKNSRFCFVWMYVVLKDRGEVEEMNTLKNVCVCVYVCVCVCV